MDELLAAVKAGAQRRRERQQDLACLLYSHALLAGQVLTGKPPDIWSAFPVWTDEEVKQMRLAKYQAIMRRHAAGDSGGGQA